MAVTSLLTVIENFEGAPSFTSIGGGSGATTNTDIFIEGSQSAGRRVDNTTGGFYVNTASTDLSGAGVHVKVWCFITQWASVTALGVRLYSGVDDEHSLPSGEFPALGGFIPIWVDVSRTPETGGSANEAAITQIGFNVAIGNVGGNAQNVIMDEIAYGTSGLRWDGTGGDFADFDTYEASNAKGVVVVLNGVYFCYARLEIGSATATTFTDSGFTVIFPDQALVADTFMGLSVDLQNASTAIDLSNGTIQSANVTGATKRPDFIVSGTSGTLDLTAVNILGMRAVDLTSAVTVDGGIIEAVDLTHGAATISGAVIRPNTASGVAMCNDFTPGDVSNTTFVQAGLGHAIEITTPGTYSFTSLFFSGFGADASNAAAVYNNSGGAVTINIAGGGDTPTVRNGTSATTTINNAVSVTLDGLIAGSRIYIENTTDSTVLFNTTEPTTTFTDTVNFTGAKSLLIRVRNASGSPKYKAFQTTGTLTSAGFSLTVNQELDE